MKKKLFISLLFIGILTSLTGCGKEEYYCCNDGDTLTEDGDCLGKKIMTTDVTYTCPNGYIAKRNGVCYRRDGTRAMYATPTYSCPDGGTVSGNQCVKYYSYTPTKCDKEDSNKNTSKNTLDVNEVQFEEAISETEE